MVLSSIQNWNDPALATNLPTELADSQVDQDHGTRVNHVTDPHWLGCDQQVQCHKKAVHHVEETLVISLG